MNISGLIATISPNYKKIILILFDMILLSCAIWLAFSIRLGEWFPVNIKQAIPLFFFIPLVSIPIFLRIGLYRAVIRYIGQKAIVAIAKAITLLTFMFVLFVILFEIKGIPRSVFILFWGISFLFIGGSRFFIRSLLHASAVDNYKQSVVVYGAGATGAEITKILQIGNDYRPVAFLDDNTDLYGSEIHGIKVYPSDKLQQLVDKYNVKDVLLALPSVTHKRRYEILEKLEPYPVQIKSVPGMVELLSGKANVSDITEIKIEDLLGRDVVSPREPLLDSSIRGKSIFVSGAGGSIGSELCRQIVRFSPKRLVLFELSEFALYKIDSELNMNEKNKLIDIIPVLGSITNKEKVETVLKSLNIQVIYHAAAYKHVPLVESNPIEGVWNNVIGTWRCAEAAIAANIEKFILISTDKAVRPTNVMGATKRMAELVLQALARKYTKPIFSMVRFGNVLGSSGSVVPLFRGQIRKGGPVTVTHPEITRYFMTISEASQLVLQASTMGEGGDVFVLDMGEPVKIVDLARSMIHLSGHDVKDDAGRRSGIEIKYTGLRPGEKLYEELLIGDNASGTEHPKIMRAEENELPYDVVIQYLKLFEKSCMNFDAENVVAILKDAVIEFNPKSQTTDPVWENQKLSKSKHPESSEDVKKSDSNVIPQKPLH